MKSLVTILLLSLIAAAAQAKTLQVFCKPNDRAHVSQFAGLAELEVASDNSVSGTFQYATQASHTSESSAFKTVNVSGKMEVISAGSITTDDVVSFELQSNERDSEAHMHLNSGMPLMPDSSTLLLERKDKYSAACSVHGT